MEELRVRLINLEMNVVYACNLKCEYCSHLGRFMKGHVPLKELLVWYKAWNPKIHPENVRIMGGEPLLHPDLEKVIYETRKHWNDSSIELITNGLLFSKMDACIFIALKNIQANVTVSKHFDDPSYNKIFDKEIGVLEYHGILPRIQQSNGGWMKCYQIDSLGHPKPFDSDPEKAWNNCYVRNVCATLIDNQLYRCPQLGCFSYARRKGFVNQDWKTALEYKPLSSNCSRKDLEDFMNAGACDQCSICPEEFQYADMYEKINPFGLPAFHRYFCGGGNHE